MTGMHTRHDLQRAAFLRVPQRLREARHLIVAEDDPCISLEDRRGNVPDPLQEVPDRVALQPEGVEIGAVDQGNDGVQVRIVGSANGVVAWYIVRRAHAASI